jgi:hypothetical protein
MAVLYDISCTIERYFYLVVRVILAADNADDGDARQAKQLRRCVLKVSDRITAGGTSADCQAAAAELAGMNPALLKGIFTHENRLLILPELSPVLCPQPAV